jgi:2-oxoglutarate dehydrogenase E2 component (dihydrolipoamide succinyltransferase)
MKVEIKIPTMGESVSEAVVSAILKPNGSIVKVDEEILELETDKVNQVLYAPAAGELNLQVNIDETVKIAQVIGFVDTEKAGKAPAKAAPEKPAAPAKAETTTPSKQTEKEHNARKMQEDFLADVSQQKKASPQPTLTKVKEPAATEGKETRKKMTKLRKVIAEKLVEAKNSTAMLTTFNEIDMSAVMAIRTKEKDAFASRYGVRLGFMSFFVKAVVNALKMIPEVNAYIDGEDIVSVNTYDIGVAVATDKGLMVPVIRDCDKQSFGQIESSIENYAKKAREGTISVDDLKGGSFTITNGGRFGSLLSTPILNLPQSAILGMHAIVRRPIAVGDKIEIRPMMYVALSYDHRIIDGKEAVLFLVNIKENLEDPARLLLDL